MKWTLHQKITLISLLVVCTLLGIDVLYNSDALQAKTLASFDPTSSGFPTQNSPIIPPTPDAVPTLAPKKEASFDPADYGLPPEIGGYQIRVAVSWETRLCNPSTDLELYLYAIPNQPQTLTTADVERLKDITHRAIHLSFVSWPISISEIESQSDNFNAISCINFGGSIQDYPTGDNGSLQSDITPQNNPIIPPTPDTGSIIMPPTAVIDLASSAFPTQNAILVPPTFDGTLIATTTTDASYDPAYWGLPAQIGGYEIMAVIALENQACSPPNELQLLLRALPNQPQTLTTADEQHLETIVHRSIRFSFSSGVVSIEQVKSQTESWNAWMAGGCITLGGPIPSVTPNPDDPISMTSYDPAYWGLPETIAGYKLLAMKTVESSKCVPNAVVQLVLQMSQSEVDRLTKATYDTIMSELNNLHWNIEWRIGYVEPGTSKENLVSVCAPNLNRDELR